MKSEAEVNHALALLELALRYPHPTGQVQSHLEGIWQGILWTLQGTEAVDFLLAELERAAPTPRRRGIRLGTRRKTETP